MRRYCVQPDIHIERFDEKAILFVAEQDRLITVNAASADLLQWVRDRFGAEPFNVVELASGLSASFAIDSHKASVEGRRLIGFGRRQGLVGQVQEEATDE